MVTVQFNVPAQYADIRILEYAGIDTVNPVDVTAARTGSQQYQQHGGGDHHQRQRPAVCRQHGGDVHERARHRVHESDDHDARRGHRGGPDRHGDRELQGERDAESVPAPGSCRWWRSRQRAARADTTPPSAPTGLTATAAGSSGINLSWTASTDNVGVTGYRVERCQGAGCSSFAQVGTPAGTTFADSGSDGEHELQLPGAGVGCGGEPERRTRTSRARPRRRRHDAADGADGADGDGGGQQRRSI